jgi:hypothetical protein
MYFDINDLYRPVQHRRLRSRPVPRENAPQGTQENTLAESPSGPPTVSPSVSAVEPTIAEPSDWLKTVDAPLGESLIGTSFDSRDILRGIIFSEFLGKPRAKRIFRR